MKPKRYSCTVIGAETFATSDPNVSRITIRLVTDDTVTVIDQARKLVPLEQLADLHKWRVAEITEILERP